MSTWGPTAVAASTDDGHQTGSGGTPSLDAAYVLVQAATGASPTKAAFRFLNVTIPAGSTISAAEFRVYVENADYDDALCDIYGSDEADAATIAASAGAGDVWTRSRTTATLAWVGDGLGVDWVAHDVTDIVAEIVALEGWASGNDIMMLIDGRASQAGVKSLRLESWDGTPARAATLEITYTVPVQDSITLDAIVSKTQAASVTLDAIVSKELAASFTLDAITAVVPSASVTLDAIVQKTIAASLTADAIVQVTQSDTLTLDAITSIVASGSITLDAIVEKTLSVSITADAIVQVTQSGSFIMRGMTGILQSGSFTLDAFLCRVITLDAIITKTQATSLTMDAITAVLQTGSFTLDAIIKVCFTLDAIIQKTMASTLTLDAYIAWYSAWPTAYNVWTRLSDVDPSSTDSGDWIDKDWLDKVQVCCTALEQKIGLNPQGTFGSVAARVAHIAAKMQIMGFGSVTLDSIISSTLSGSFTLDAVTA